MKANSIVKSTNQRHNWQSWKRIHKELIRDYKNENKHDPWFEYNAFDFIDWVENRFGFLIIRDECGLITPEYFMVDPKKFTIFEIRYS